MEGLEFPFPYREGQRDVVSGVYRTILRKMQLFVQAPTGVGKTMSTIFPAVRSMGEGTYRKNFLPHSKNHNPHSGLGSLSDFKKSGTFL